jgi:hypothetical protein
VASLSSEMPTVNPGGQIAVGAAPEEERWVVWSPNKTRLVSNAQRGSGLGKTVNFPAERGGCALSVKK